MRKMIAILPVLTFAVVALAQNVEVPSGTVLPLELKTYINTKKANPGDDVKLEVIKDVRGANNDVLIPRKAKVTAKISRVQPKTDKSDAVVSLMITKAEWKGGSANLHAVIAGNVRPPEVNTEILASSNPKGQSAVGMNNSGREAVNENLSQHTGERQAGTADSFRLFRGSLTAAGQATGIEGIALRLSEQPEVYTELFSKKNFELESGSTFSAKHFLDQGNAAPPAAMPPAPKK